MEDFDVIVIGAGHAGIEAGLASARLGAKTAVFTLSLDAVGNMPCNPSIGGTAKGHIVYEIDALGGEMSRAADATTLQSRTLNMGRGAAVHSRRTQNDRMRYHEYMKSALEKQTGLSLVQDEVVGLIVESGEVRGVRTRLVDYSARAVVCACGTYLGGLIHIGDAHYPSGPDNVAAAQLLSRDLLEHGLPMRRFKTGTPARVHRRSIDFSLLERQDGEMPAIPFCMATRFEIMNREPCYIAYTNENTHRVIRENLNRSPLYGGIIEGVGPRYCPSIEDKVVRFPERERHQIFVEPCGESTEEMYLQGMSSSLPLDVQTEMYRTIRGFEGIEIMRPAYAIEYDCCDPLALNSALMVKSIKGLFGAGQFNGTSGYEEAAAQGLVAGVNAAKYALGGSPLILPRDGSYIGTLIDDLVTKGVNDPYRMMTSRSEHRLYLRQDNADSRLCETGRQAGLLDDERWGIYNENAAMQKRMLARLSNTSLKPSDELNKLLVDKGGLPIEIPTPIIRLLRRPRVSYSDLRPFDTACVEDNPLIWLKTETEIKYSGYMKRENDAALRLKRLESEVLPEGIDYKSVRGLRLEAAEKLTKIRPSTLGEASRISGVNPADITVLAVHLRKEKSDD